MGMIDREKVIKGLEICTSKPCYCTDCPYKPNCYLDSQEVMEDALSLLKEHVEQKKGFWLYPTSLDCHCSVCGEQPEHEPGASVPLYNYCPYCGAEMEPKWDD